MSGADCSGTVPGGKGQLGAVARAAKMSSRTSPDPPVCTNFPAPNESRPP